MSSIERLSYARVIHPGGPAGGVPQVAFEAPAHWTPGPAPGGALVLREPASLAGRFRANLVLSIDRLGPVASLATVATAVLREARTTGEWFELDDECGVQAAGRAAIQRRQRIGVGGEHGPVLQLVLITLVDVDGGAARDCIQLTASIGGGREPLGVDLFDRAVASLDLAPEAA